MKDIQRLIDSIDQLNANIIYLIERIENPSSTIGEIQSKAEKLRYEKKHDSTKQRTKERTRSNIEIQGAVPFVVKRLLSGMTNEAIALEASSQGYEFSRSSVGRFYANIEMQKTENGCIYVVMKSGNTYILDENSFEMISATGKF